VHGGGLDDQIQLLSERGRGMFVVDQLTCGSWGFRGLQSKGFLDGHHRLGEMCCQVAMNEVGLV
jgi:hypothetical protein